MRRGSDGKGMIHLSAEEERAARLAAEGALHNSELRVLELEARVDTLERKLATLGLNGEDTSATPDRVCSLLLEPCVAE